MTNKDTRLYHCLQRAIREGIFTVEEVIVIEMCFDVGQDSAPAIFTEVIEGLLRPEAEWPSR